MNENRFDCLYRAIVHREPMSPPPPFELGIGRDLRAACLGRPIQSLQDDVDFWAQAGYCLYPVTIGLLHFGSIMVVGGRASHVAHSHYSLYRDEDVEMAWAATDRGVICSQEDFEKFPWPDPEQADLATLDAAGRLLPHGMKIVANIGKIFTGAWQLMGFNCFAESLHDQPDLVDRVIARVAKIQSRITERVIQHPAVGAVLHADDLAYFSGLMINPKVLRQFVFPAYKNLSAACHKRKILYLFHSDGDVRGVIPDIVDCGFQGLHPIEPKPLDARQIKRDWGQRICLLGHIDVDLLSRGTPQEIRDKAIWCLDNLARDGGYCAGSANSVPDYVPKENYLAMMEAIRAWRPG